MSSSDSIIWDASRLQDEASRCVKCGLCLAECPTYRLSENEARSPRGRIALVEALAAREVEAGGLAHDLLASCLLCRRCEKVCPSGVAFGRILDEGRRMVRARLPLKVRLATGALSRPVVARRLPGLARIAGRLLPRNSPAARLGRRASRGGVPGFGIHPARDEVRGRVGLFLGCTAGLLDGKALEGAVRLLTRAGYEVHVPRGQGCCGALELHAGNPERAARLAKANRVAFGLDGLDAVVGVSSGCGAHLAEHGGLGYREIGAFLLESGALERLAFRPLEARVALHLPCTLENVLDGSEPVRRLLRAVPGLEVVEVGRPGGCCGAGGLGFLADPVQSRRIGEPLMAEIRRLAPRFVVTANAGCGLHLESGAPGPEYLHPVTLLARQLVAGVE